MFQRAIPCCWVVEERGKTPFNTLKPRINAVILGRANLAAMFVFR